MQNPALRAKPTVVTHVWQNPNTGLTKRTIINTKYPEGMKLTEQLDSFQHPDGTITEINTTTRYQWREEKNRWKRIEQTILVSLKDMQGRLQQTVQSSGLLSPKKRQKFIKTLQISEPSRSESFQNPLLEGENRMQRILGQLSGFELIEQPKTEGSFERPFPACHAERSDIEKQASMSSPFKTEADLENLLRKRHQEHREKRAKKRLWNEQSAPNLDEADKILKNFARNINSRVIAERKKAKELKQIFDVELPQL